MVTWLFSAIFSAMLAVLMTSSDVSTAHPGEHDTSAHDNTTDCLQAVREAAEDKNRFWFGTQYKIGCQNHSRFFSECYNPIQNDRDSLLSRIFKRKVHDGMKLEIILKVTYKTHTGSYLACGNAYEIYKSRLIHIDNPLRSNSDQSLSPFELLSTPRVTWEGLAASSIPPNPPLHTLVLIDAGYVTVNALYINIPTFSSDGGQTVVSYLPPINPTSNDNPYIFLLFVQNDSIELSPQWLHNLSLRSVAMFEDFLIQFELDGPVGISWFTLRSDPYSADNAENSPGNMNTCAQFVDKAFKTKKLPYLPKDTPELSVYLDITFVSPPIVFSCCCNTYSYEATTYKPNPIGDGEARAALMRRDGKRTFIFRKSTAFPLQSRDFKGELHTLIMVDPDSPFAIYGSPLRPYVHMLVSNIREGNFNSGQVVLPYSGPWPPDPDHHTYYFLLFKQKGYFEPSFEDYAFMNCSGIFKGRCGFNMAALIQDGGLELVGASWQLIKSTDYVRCVLVSLGVNETEICGDIDGYTPLCAPQGGDIGNMKNGNNTACPIVVAGKSSHLINMLVCVIVMFLMCSIF